MTTSADSIVMCGSQPSHEGRYQFAIAEQFHAGGQEDEVWISVASSRTATPRPTPTSFSASTRSIAKTREDPRP